MIGTTMAIVCFVYTFYFVLKVLNESVWMTEEEIVARNIWGKQTKYRICDVSRVIVSNKTHSAYVRIIVGKNKIKIEKGQKNYEAFKDELCYRFKLTGYSRSGKHVWDIIND